jgi:tRNA G18 (ribose-2'-O)-methylase SpoU
MARIEIDDLDDPRLVPFRALKVTNRTRRSDLFVVEGLKLVERLAASRFPLVSVVVTDRVEPRVETRLPVGVDRFVVPHGKVDELVGFNFHQGVLGAGRRMPWPDWMDIAQKENAPLLLVICPKLDSPDNLGSIIRLADAFGVDAIVAGEQCPDPLSRRVLRVSMGSSLRVAVLSVANLVHAAEQLRARSGVELWAASAGRDAEPFTNPPVPGRLALVLGNESGGLEAAWIERCDRKVGIPMREGVDSLNVAVAAGILLSRVTESEILSRSERRL